MKKQLLETKNFLLYSTKKWPKTTEEIVELVQNNDNVKANEVSLTNFYDTFISWYRDSLEGTETYKQDKTKVMKKLINKMATWFEFKYSYNRIVELIPCFEGRKDSDGTAPGEELMPIEQFYKTLAPEERELLKVPAHQKIVYFDNQGKDYFCVDTKGKIISVEGNLRNLIPENKRGIINDRKLIGMDLMAANDLFRREGIFITKPPIDQDRKIDNADIIMATTRYQYDSAIYNGLLDSVMAKIIDSGGPIIGPRRGLLFAEEFDRDLRFPMLYSHSNLDTSRNDFIDYFVNHSSLSSAPCIIGYFDGLNPSKPFQTSDLKKEQLPSQTKTPAQRHNSFQFTK